MANVYEAIHIATQQKVALKLLLPLSDPFQNAQCLQLFEREFMTLAQIGHPRIVAAYDFGVDVEHGAFYAMELLDGGDLQERSPLPFREACTFARDVCSALAFLHSRRLLYRDLSPRNVRCTAAGAAKLIDFGALTAMGLPLEVVGTAPFVAPEVLQRLPLDDRTDLYSLGATLYYALTGQHAFPARAMAQLWELWRVRPPAPSSLVEGIPASLDLLVLQLIQFEPQHRPASAAEVMQRLEGIAGLSADEDQLLRMAYMVAPKLVGREKELRKIKGAVAAAKNGSANSTLVLGNAGVGRSRFLDEGALLAKVQGVLTVQVTAQSSDSDYALLRGIVSELLQTVPELAADAVRPDLAPLIDVVPELTLRAPNDTKLGTPRAHGEHERIQRAACAWLTSVARQHPLCVVVDEAKSADMPTLALLRQLLREQSNTSFQLIWSIESSERAAADLSPAHTLLEQESTVMTLQPLSGAEVQELLLSIFGEVPNLVQLARYVESTAAGNPRDSLRLLQHLVNERLIGHDGASWILPAQLSASELPSSMLEAIAQRVAKLRPSARLLAAAFAAEPNERFSLEESRLLADEHNLALVLSDLAQNLEAGVLTAVGATYRVAQAGFADALHSSESSATLSLLHSRLARVFESRTDLLRRAKHLLAAGDETEGLDLLIRSAVESKRRTDTDMRRYFDEMRALPADWLLLYQRGIALCETSGRPARDKEAILSRLAGFIPIATTATGVEGFAVLRIHLAQLVEQVGLDLYAALPVTLDAGTRIGTALTQAKLRFEHSAPERRIYEPVQAIGPLATTLLSSLGLISITNDVQDHRALPSLDPLVPLSPALWIVQKTAEGLGARIEGRFEAAHAIYQAVMERLSRADRGGLQAAEHQSTWLRVGLSAGTLEACMGLKAATERIAQIALEPDYETQALMLRHLCELWQGDLRSASNTKRAVEHRLAFARTRNNYDGQYLLGQIVALSLLDDLTGLRHMLDAAQRMAAVHPNWEPVALFCQGELERVRGTPKAALASLTQAMSLVGGAGQHQIWANIAAAHVRVLLELGECDKAIERGEVYLAAAIQHGLGYFAHYIRIPISNALCRTDPLAAREMADQVVEGFQALGASGLNMVLALENRARVALETEGPAAFEHYAALSNAQNEIVSGRLRRALQTAHGEHPAEPLGPPSELRSAVVSEIKSVLRTGTELSVTMQRVLRLLITRTAARGAALYSWRGEALERVAVCGEVLHLAALDEWARVYVEGQVAAQDATTSMLDRLEDVPTASRSLPGGMYVPHMLGHELATDFAYTGLLVLALPGISDFTWLGAIADQLSRSIIMSTM